MRLTWDDFLKLAAVITNLRNSILDFGFPLSKLVEKRRGILAAVQRYQDFFKDSKYSECMEKIRISQNVYKYWGISKISGSRVVKLKLD